jgi:hypothetical protein
MSRRDDDLKDSFYLYIMRNSIGAGLKTQYSANESTPDRITELLQELDETEDRGVGERPAGEEPHRPIPRHVRKQ